MRQSLLIENIGKSILASVFTALLTLALCFMVNPQTAMAQDDRVIVGLGAGAINFSADDEIRALQDMDRGAMGDLFAEYYPLESLGFGFRVIQTWVDKDITHIRIANQMLTASLVSGLIADYARVGVMAGFGSSLYSHEVNSPAGCTHATSEGQAQFADAFLDWGAEGIGARLGVRILKTDLDNLNGVAVDGSGTGWYLHLRWSIE